MKLKHLKLVGYRNYEELSLDLSDGTNIFIGRNAQWEAPLGQILITTLLCGIIPGA